MKRIYILVGIAFFAITTATLWNHQADEKKKRPNIILIMSDDQSWKHAGAYGDNTVRTPNFDLLAAGGVLFENAYCSAPACAPSRASMLAGRNFWELEEAAIHFSFFPEKIEIFTDILADNEYFVGYTGKGWGPGIWQGYRKKDPSGLAFQNKKYQKVPKGINENHYSANFIDFYHKKGDSPFFFLLGTTEPHRDLAYGMGKTSGLLPDSVQVPGFLPDDPVVREDILDYYYEIEWFDKQLGEVLLFLEEENEMDNTVIIVTSDNGMAFPRAKSNLYDYGSRLPLLVYWKDKISGPRVVSDFVSLPDLAPTVLEMAGIPIPASMTKKSLMPILLSQNEGRINEHRDFVVMGKELHAWCHPEGAINPVRAIRTDDYLYIENMKPNMWPAGHPDAQYAWDLKPYGDVDWGPTKAFLIENIYNDEINKFYHLAFSKRPDEELYYIHDDPWQINNLAYKPGYKEVKIQLQNRMRDYLVQYDDPRTNGNPKVFDEAPYFWSHGLETGGLPPSEWEALSTDEKSKHLDSIMVQLKGT